MANAFRQRLMRDAPDDEVLLRLQGQQPRGPMAGDAPDLSQEPNGQMLTPVNQAAITRPRVYADTQPIPERRQLPSTVDNPPPQGGYVEPGNPDVRQRAVSFDQQTGRPNEDFYRNNPDPVEAASGVYNAYQNWQPHGAKRGFKNSLKAGAMYAADAVRAHPEDPVAAAAAGFATGVAGGTAAPNFKNRLTREWKLKQSGQDLQNQLGLAKEKATIDAAGFVPMVVNGQIVQVPRKSAGTVALGQGRLGETRRRNDAYIGHLNDLPKEKQAEGARKLYQSGIADGNDELKAELAKRMGLTEELPDSDKGTVQVDAAGNLKVVHTRAGTATDVTDDSGAPVGSFQRTQEKGRDARARAQRENSRGNALIMAGRQVGALGDPADWEKQAQDADDDAKLAEDQAAELAKSNYPSDKVSARQYVAEAERHRRQARDLRGNAIKAKGAQSGVSGQGVPAASKPTLEGAIKAFKARAKRDPTPDELANIKQHYGFQ